jgi:pimeloyl-ACP methyl ester carboxylesterase
MGHSMTRDLRSGGDWAHGMARVNGTDMHYVREGKGPALFLLHGWPEFWWGWHRNIPALAERYDVVAPDFRGFGETTRIADEQFGPSEHAADILALADALGVRRFGLVAHDLGAYVAQSIARAAPERLSGLFFFNGPHPGIGRRWVDADHVREIWYQSFNQLPWAEKLVGHDRATCRIFFEGMLRHWTHAPGAVDGLIEGFVDNFMRPGNIAGGFVWYRATHAARMALVRDGSPDLPKIEIPSRFFWGRHDPIIRADWANTVPDYFTDATVEIAEGAGHFVHFETPGPANARVAEFFPTLR